MDAPIIPNNIGSSSRAPQPRANLPPLPPRSATDLESKKLRRTILNREYARKSRARQQEYFDQLFQLKEVKEAQIARMSPQIPMYEARIDMLQRENLALRLRIEEMEYEAYIGEAATTSLKQEREMLLMLQMLQQQK